MVTSTSSATVTRYFSLARYRNATVFLTSPTFSICPHESVQPLHHEDEEGRHWCPTGFIVCQECGAIGDEPEPFSCHVHGEKP